MASDGKDGEILLINPVNAVPGNCIGSSTPIVTGRLNAAMQIVIESQLKALMLDG